MTNNNELLKELFVDKDPIEPETLDKLFPTLSHIEKQKIQIIKLVQLNNLVFHDMDVFENAIQVLNDIDPDIEKTEGCKPEWLWYGINELLKIQKNNFSEEVKAYIKWNFKEAGVKFYPPSVFKTEKENPLLNKIIKIAHEGPFPLKEDTPINIQVLHYLKIQQYIKEKNN